MVNIRRIISEEIQKYINENTKTEIDKLAQKADKHPTEAQKKAGNYRMGHIYFQGMKISIENPKGSYRCGVDDDGKQWKILMHNHYGYFANSVGKDGDNVDVFIGNNVKSDKVFVVDQKNSKGEFDESKVMLGFDDKKQAKKAYLSNYSKDWKGFMKITEVPISVFKEWLYNGRKQQKAFKDYSIVNNNSKKIEETVDKNKKSGLDKFLEKHGIKKSSNCLGFSEKEQKWYGWSHRAIYGFGIGSKVKKGDCAYNGKEWTAKTLNDAKKMAQNFADDVA